DSTTLKLIRQRLSNAPSYANRATVEPVRNQTTSNAVQVSVNARSTHFGGRNVSGDRSEPRCTTLPVRTSDICQNNSTRNEPRSQNVCEVCGKILYYQSNLERHMLKHSATQNWKCDICGVKFKHRCSLQNHKEKKHFSAALPSQSHKFQCGVCQKSFDYQSELKRHIPMHSPTKKFACPKCGRKFQHKGSARRHELMCNCEDATE
ncbi:zinc finger protein 710, partial [Clonorchis sinensis]